MPNNIYTTNVTNVKYVIGPGGVRMTYQEWLEMRKAEMD